MKLEAVDLFCGIGGLTYGVKSAGIKVLAGIDIDNSCAYGYHENNTAPFICKPIEEVCGQELLALYSSESIKVLMGCAPCQPFSRYSYRYNKNGYKRDEWKLLYEFSRLIVEVQPDIVSMENVPKLRSSIVFADFVKVLEREKYKIWWDLVNSADYGVPQSRRRLVLLASKFGNIELIEPLFEPENYKTVRCAIGHLPQIKHGERSTKDFMHKASGLNKTNQARIRQSIPGGTWKDWDDALLLNCHRKSSGQTYRSVYGRMEWDKPAPTITTQFYGYGNGRFGHPEQDRAISLREGAILQSFPDNYKFYESVNELTNRQIGTHIGNAVPILLAKAIGDSIQKHIKERGDKSDRNEG